MTAEKEIPPIKSRLRRLETSAFATTLPQLDTRYERVAVAIGDGIDATGSTDSTDGLQAIIDATDGGRLFIPGGSYKISEPLVIPAGLNIYGAGASPAWDGATRIIADAGFSGLAMLMNNNWTLGDWWHWSSIRNLSLDGSGVAANGIALYQMGEVSGIFDVQVDDCVDRQIWLTGAHAPCTLQNITVNGRFGAEENGAYGVHLSEHPDVDGETLNGNAGVVRINGLSGDWNKTAWLRISGSHQVTISGPKSERNYGSTFLIDGSGTGGASPSLTVIGGYSQDPDTCDEVVKISDTATPSIVFVGYGYTPNGSVNLINDEVLERTIPLATGTEPRIQFFSYGGGGRSIFGQTMILTKGLPVSAMNFTTGAIHEMLIYGSDDRVRLQGGTASGGVALRSHSGALQVHINDTGLGFYGATPAAKPAITGSRGGNAALADLLTKLATLGILTDSTS